MCRQNELIKTKIPRLKNNSAGRTAIGIFLSIFLTAVSNPIWGQKIDKPVYTGTMLFPGKTVSRTCSAKPSESGSDFKPRVNRGQYFRVVIERDPQLSNAVDVRVTDWNIKELLNKSFEQEPSNAITFSTVAKLTDGYSFAVNCYGEARYKITLVERGRATAKEKRTAGTAVVPQRDDEKRRAAEAKAKFLTDRLRPNANGQMLNWANKDDLREIVGRFNEGAQWWHAAGNHVKEFETFQEVARIYGDLGDLPAALKTTRQAIAVARETGKSSLEFSALYGIGQIYRQIGNAPRAVEYLNQSLDILRSKKLRADWLAQYQSGEYGDAAALRYNHLRISHAEIFDRQTDADLRGLETRILMELATIHQQLGAKVQAAQFGAQALEVAQRTAASGIGAFGYGELFKIARRAAQFFIDAGNRERARQIIADEIVRVGDIPEVEQIKKNLTELQKLIESGATDLKGNDTW